MLAWQTVQNSRDQRVRNIWTPSGQEHLNTFLLLMASRVEEKTGTSLRKFGFKIVLDKITNSCKSFCFRLVWETQTFDNVLSHCTQNAHIFLVIVNVICHGKMLNISTYSCQFSPSLNGCNCLKIPAIVVQQWRSVVVVLKSKKKIFCWGVGALTVQTNLSCNLSGGEDPLNFHTLVLGMAPQLQRLWLLWGFPA